MAAGLLKSAVVCALLYLPWFLFAWSYYGSPVPQTVIAKEAGYAGTLDAAGALGALTRLPGLWSLTFLPPYAREGDWSLLRPLAGLLGAVGSLFWLLPRTGASGRRASIVACGALLYLGVIGLNSPWYFPPILALSIPPLRDALALAAFGRRRLLRLPLACLLVAMLSWLLLDYGRIARALTLYVEQENRQAAGEWLRGHARPGDRVFLECPGIIGWYSGLKMLDYPGLVSPEVSDVVRKQGRGLARAALTIAPEWMVLRPYELSLVRSLDDEGVRRDYEIARVFDHKHDLETILPDHRSVLYDSVFIVLHRRTAPGP